MQYLVIMRLKPSVSRDELTRLSKPEAAKAWEMMAAGVLRSIHFIKGPAGAVLLFEANGEKEVEAHVAQLPLVNAGIATAEFCLSRPSRHGGALCFAASLTATSVSDLRISASSDRETWARPLPSSSPSIFD